MHRYNWRRAPLTARYATTDYRGTVTWWKRRPKAHVAGGYWIHRDDAPLRVDAGVASEACVDWRDSLEWRIEHGEALVAAAVFLVIGFMCVIFAIGLGVFS